MSHFALVKNGIVEDIIVAEQDFIDNVMKPQTPDGEWIQTSYNTRRGRHYGPDGKTLTGKPGLRGNYAQIGGKYDKDKDVFIPVQPYDDWVLDDDGLDWAPPVPRSSNPKKTAWDAKRKEWFDPLDDNDPITKIRKSYQVSVGPKKNPQAAGRPAKD